MTEPVTAADVIQNRLGLAWKADITIDALREACGGGDIVIRTDGTLATLNLNTRYVGSHITVETFRVVPVASVERGA